MKALLTKHLVALTVLIVISLALPLFIAKAGTVSVSSVKATSGSSQTVVSFRTNKHVKVIGGYLITTGASSLYRAKAISYSRIGKSVLKWQLVINKTFESGQRLRVKLKFKSRRGKRVNKTVSATVISSVRETVSQPVTSQPSSTSADQTATTVAETTEAMLTRLITPSLWVNRMPCAYEVSPTECTGTEPGESVGLAFTVPSGVTAMNLISVSGVNGTMPTNLAATYRASYWYFDSFQALEDPAGKTLTFAIDVTYNDQVYRVQVSGAVEVAV